MKLHISSINVPLLTHPSPTTHAPHRNHQIPSQRCCDLCHRLLTAFQFIPSSPVPTTKSYLVIGIPWLPVQERGVFFLHRRKGFVWKLHTGGFVEAQEPTFKQQMKKGEKITKRKRSQHGLLESGSRERRPKEGPGTWGLFIS